MMLCKLGSGSEASGGNMERSRVQVSLFGNNNWKPKAAWWPQPPRESRLLHPAGRVWALPVNLVYLSSVARPGRPKARETPGLPKYLGTLGAWQLGSPRTAGSLADGVATPMNCTVPLSITTATDRPRGFPTSLHRSPKFCCATEVPGSRGSIASLNLFQRHPMIKDEFTCATSLASAVLGSVRCHKIPAVAEQTGNWRWKQFATNASTC
ncbi:hypothetical protein B0J18DRAFT_150597 [Chaetomium sp. MPI-SDFR-AT-0129]|nr:hypothetical protein B0J18DRAFT_150597 [Chaetomium sp. MPI-SDFR-AT-0129]